MYMYKYWLHYDKEKSLKAGINRKWNVTVEWIESVHVAIIELEQQNEYNNGITTVHGINMAIRE